MIVKIYDFANNPVDVELPDCPIVQINVTVLSGDEVVTFVMEDFTIVRADSCPGGRYLGFYDGEYAVTTENVGKWLDMKPKGGRTFSYQRMDKFCGDDEQ